MTHWKEKRKLLFSFFTLLCVNLCKGKPSRLCPRSEQAVIRQTCKFLPGLHSFKSLFIREEIFLETTSASSAHFFVVNETMEIASNAVIHVGYATITNTSTDICAGYGGSFGGRGGAPAHCSLKSNQSRAYGDVFNVTEGGSPGSGSGAGRGGAFIHIQTRKLIHQGIIRANGQQGVAGSRGGGGSGGGVSIDSQEIEGSGRIEVLGGPGGSQGGPGGGGGRVSVRSAASTSAFSWPTVTYGGATGNKYTKDNVFICLAIGSLTL